MELKIIGGGLAGCEAAWQAANRGIKVRLSEMKPLRFSPAHTNKDFGELVCSNSLKGNGLDNACGLLKEEMRRMNSLIISCADETRVPAGGALAVDRDKFAALITERIKSHENIETVSEVVSDINTDEFTIVATGPLSDGSLNGAITALTGCEALSFFDAAAPVVTAESIDAEKTYMAARYNKGTADYINCPMNQEEYEAFYEALVNAERAELHDCDKNFFRVYEGCMPIEILASRGKDTMRFGPLKPVGLTDPRTGRRPYAVIQLRRENQEGTMYNIVGFQTNLKFGEQKRVFSMIPGLEHAEFVRYGVMHRNSFLDSPRLLGADYALRSNPNCFFAGQMTGVEGYIESAASGILAGQNLARRMQGKAPLILPRETMMGALAAYISDETVAQFQPMGCNMGILPELPERIRDKREKYQAYADRALAALDAYLQQTAENTTEGEGQ